MSKIKYIHEQKVIDGDPLVEKSHAYPLVNGKI